LGHFPFSFFEGNKASKNKTKKEKKSKKKQKKEGIKRVLAFFGL